MEVNFIVSKNKLEKNDISLAFIELGFEAGVSSPSECCAPEIVLDHALVHAFSIIKTARVAGA